MENRALGYSEERLCNSPIVVYMIAKGIDDDVAKGNVPVVYGLMPLTNRFKPCIIDPSTRTKLYNYSRYSDFNLDELYPPTQRSYFINDIWILLASFISIFLSFIYESNSFLCPAVNRQLAATHRELVVMQRINIGLPLIIVVMMLSSSQRFSLIYHEDCNIASLHLDFCVFLHGLG